MQLIYSLLADSITKRDDGRYDFGGVRHTLIMTAYPTRVQTNYFAMLRGRPNEAPIGAQDVGLWVYTGHTEEGAEAELDPTWMMPEMPDMNLDAIELRGEFYLALSKPLDLGIPSPMTWVFELRIRGLRLPQLRFKSTLPT